MRRGPRGPRRRVPRTRGPGERQNRGGGYRFRLFLTENGVCDFAIAIRAALRVVRATSA